MIIEYRGKRPRVDPSAFVAPTAVLIGDVEVGEHASIWFGAVLRADNGPIRIGARSNIQDNSVLHVTARGGTYVKDDVTVGHAVTLEDCTIGNGALVGSNAVVLNGATVGEGTLVAAGSVVPKNITIAARTLVAGIPARLQRSLDDHAGSHFGGPTQRYIELSRSYLQHGIGDPEMHEFVSVSGISASYESEEMLEAN